MPTATLADANVQRNGRRLRMLVALIVLFLLWWYLLGVVDREAYRAEQMSANVMLSQMRSALVVRGAEVMLARDERLENQVGLNPIELLDQSWSRYLGLCERALPAPGYWCFQNSTEKTTENRRRGWLIYQPARPITLAGRSSRVDQPLAWAVTTDFADRNNNGQREQEERLTGLKLEPVALQPGSVQRQDAEH
ncbi:MAG: hypothetical protein JJ867_09125 [Marinobacter sp.]|nr:hypothetical protein [Marinobacter sp.]